MDDDDGIFTTDGHEFKCTEEQASFKIFLQEEGAPLLEFYRRIEDRNIRLAFANLLMAVSKSYDKDI